MDGWMDGHGNRNGVHSPHRPARRIEVTDITWNTRDYPKNVSTHELRYLKRGGGGQHNPIHKFREDGRVDLRAWMYMLCPHGSSCVWWTMAVSSVRPIGGTRKESALDSLNYVPLSPRQNHIHNYTVFTQKRKSHDWCLKKEITKKKESRIWYRF